MTPQVFKVSMTARYIALSAAVVLTIIAYTVYWFKLADRIELGFAAWADARRAGGMVIEYGTFEITGFPLRVQPQITNVRLAGPGQHPAWQWQSARLTANVLPYNLNHIVLSAPDPQDISLRINDGELELYHLAPLNARASIALAHGKIARMDLDIEGGTLSGGRLLANVLTLGRVQLHTRDAEDGVPHGLQDPALFDISFKLENLEYPGFAGSALGAHLTSFAATGAIEGAWPATGGIAGIRQWRDDGGVTQVKAAEIDWGPLKLSAAGTLALDAQDRLIGSLNANLVNYEGLIKALHEAGQLKKDEAAAASTGLGIIAMASGGKNGALTLPMTLQDGAMFIGPLRVAKLKPLY